MHKQYKHLSISTKTLTNTFFTVVTALNLKINIYIYIYTQLHYKLRAEQNTGNCFTPKASLCIISASYWFVCFCGIFLVMEDFN